MTEEGTDIPEAGGDEEELSEGSYEFFIPAEDEHVAREKAKAREMRKSQWWKNQVGKGKCYYCGRSFSPRELTMDHIVPIIRGGFTKKNNVVPCCKQCNSEKKYMLPVEWQEKKFAEQHGEKEQVAAPDAEQGSLAKTDG